MLKFLLFLLLVAAFFWAPWQNDQNVGELISWRFEKKWEGVADGCGDLEIKDIRKLIFGYESTINFVCGFGKSGTQEVYVSPVGTVHFLTEALLRECPDEKIVNKMPSVDGQENRDYYIEKGQRRELSQYDNPWVEKNCTVPVQEVY
jgi:hypothetical protein